MSESAKSNNREPVLSFIEILPIVLSTKAVVVEADRSLKIEQDQPKESRFCEILETLGSPDFQTEEVFRLILAQMTLIIIEMKARENDPYAAVFRRDCQADLAALRVLIKVLNRTDRLRHHDVLNFDGPKFRYVLDQLTSYFKQASLNALGKDSEGMVQRIMMEFRDILAMEEPELRRSTEKMRYSKT
jgi:hypothetical protein